MWIFVSIWMVSGSASQNSRKKVFHSQAETTKIPEIYNPYCFRYTPADACNELHRNGRAVPQGVLEGAIPLSLGNAAIRSALGKLFSFKCLILITVVVLSILFYRPFCKWICPLGAIYSLFNKVSLMSIKVESSKCVGCGKCSKACKMDVDVCKTPNHPECIRCGACMKACPKDAIHYQFMGKPCSQKGHKQSSKTNM